MEKGTITMLSLVKVSQNYVQSSLGSSSFIGLGKARAVSIFFSGSYATSTGTAQLDIFGALTPHAGSVDPAAIGSLLIGIATDSTKRRIKTFTQLNEYPYIVGKLTHAGVGSLCSVLAKAIIQYD